ncbi:MAG: PKD domain-containing protein [Lewinellaceae bacterium]|nr:PKD domain-containing protein [Lewinellaceae bacterium]
MSSSTAPGAVLLHLYYTTMRIFSIILLLLPQFLRVAAQKEDNIWVFGYKYSNQVLANGIYFDFGDSLSINYSPKKMALHETCSSICDPSGALLFLSNGCYVEAGTGEYIENSSELDFGYGIDSYCINDSSGYRSVQNMLLLPHPENQNKYYLIYLSLKIEFQPLNGYFDKILFSQIDRSFNNGTGKIVLKNQIILSDTLHSDGIHAVRHANGRDWWIVAAKDVSNQYFVMLLTPEGISLSEQSIGEPTWSGSGGEMVFSPDGTKLSRFNAKDDLRIFDFDRCTGILSNPIYIPITDDADNQIFAGLAFSADGRYLYAAEVKRLIQFDTQAADIAASKTIVAERILSPDCPLGDGISFLELGPDGRIYGRHLNGQSCMHRMNHPERAGTACEMVQNYYKFDFSYKNLPHFPNFRLGPIDGSACDTLGLDNHPLAGWRYDKTGGFGVDFTSVSWYEPTEWLWDFGDPASGAANQSAERNPVHTFSAPGAYEVCLTVSNQYGSDEKCKTVWVSTTSSSGPQDAAEVVQIYPNPTTGEVRWSGLPVGEEVTVLVMNVLGQHIVEKAVTGNSIDLSALPDGMYCLQFLASGGQIIGVKSVQMLKNKK